MFTLYDAYVIKLLVCIVPLRCGSYTVEGHIAGMLSWIYPCLKSNQIYVHELETEIALIVRVPMFKGNQHEWQCRQDAYKN